jgi:ABC transport system ATP-binding/permease protein
MPLVSLLELSHAFGGPPVLDRVNFQIEAGERVCLLGRNGAGKSTLMKLLAGDIAPDQGQIFRQPGACFARLRQDIPDQLSGSVHDVVRAGVRADGPPEEEWEIELRLENLIERLGLTAGAEVATLSGGLKRRVLLGQALAARPDLLLLDEPTNHLDLAGITWLEEFLLTAGISLFFVTHDRTFLQKLATRIVELDRGVITNWDCPYATYLERRAERLEAEEQRQAAQDKKLAQEEEWVRRGVKARRTRAKGRIEQLEQLRAERRARRAQPGQVALRLAEAERSGAKVVEAEGLGFAYPGQPPLVRDLDLLITRGDKIGIIGPNGVGKTTLVRLLLGQLAPTAGRLTTGTRLEVVYFDQLRTQINDDLSVADNIADGNTTVTLGGRSRHVISYLQDFLFEPARARTPARVLSGGERNRLLLARLFTRPANVLVMDEPTNDLDLETLELLENLLVEFAGTLLIVSHDRAFLDNVVTSTLVATGDGGWRECVGGYSDWQAEEARRAAAATSAVAPVARPPAVPPRPAKLGRKERDELAALPGRIETLETEMAALTARLGDPAFYQGPAADIAAARDRLAALEAEIATAFARWEELVARE